MMHVSRFTTRSRRFACVAIVVTLGIWTACTPEKWDLGSPELIHISEYNLTTTPEQGTAEHRVEEVWVYSTTDVLGVYPLPATVALPSGHPEALTLVPGIRANGVSATRRTYPFYEVTRIETDGDPSTEMDVAFGGGYVNTDALSTKVILAEDFESANRFWKAPTATWKSCASRSPARCLKAAPAGTSAWTARTPS